MCLRSAVPCPPMSFRREQGVSKALFLGLQGSLRVFQRAPEYRGRSFRGSRGLP